MSLGRERPLGRHVAALLLGGLIFGIYLTSGGGSGRFAVEPTLAEPSATVTRGPYLQSITSSSVVVRWRTTSAEVARVWFGLAPDDLTSSVDGATATTDHEVPVSGLMPETRYYYAIGTAAGPDAGGDTSHFFDTSPVPGEKRRTRILVLGDSGGAEVNGADVRDDVYALVDNVPHDVWLLMGDDAYPNGTDAEFQAALFDMYDELLRNLPLWSTRGNHDKVRSGTNNDYYEFFTFPRDGEAGGLPSGTEAYYAFDYGNIHFICVDSEGSDMSPGSPMLRWLESDLRATDADWIIAFWHHAPYTDSNHDSDDPSEVKVIAARENVLPILESHGVDLVLTGHGHSYERSYMLNGHYDYSWTLTSEMILDDGDGSVGGDGPYRKGDAMSPPGRGAVYAVVGSSSWLVSGGDLQHPVMAFSAFELGFMTVDIQDDTLRAAFIDTSGTVIDDFTIIKSPGVEDVAGYWPLDEQNGVVAYDFSGWGRHNGSVENGATWRPGQGRYGGALELDGGDDYVDIPDIDGVDGEAALTVSGWVRFYELPAEPLPPRLRPRDAVLYPIVSKASTGKPQDQELMLGLIEPASLVFRIKAGGVTHELYTETIELHALQWYHLGATYDGATLRVYLDGREIRSKPGSGLVEAASDAPLRLGHNPAVPNSRPIRGLIDEVRIEPFALDPAAMRERAFPNQRPGLRYTVEPVSGLAPLTVACDASPTWDRDEGPVALLWNMGDGTTRTEASFLHTYPSPGAYRITITATDPQGLAAGDSLTCVVMDTLRPAPEAVPFTYSVIDTAPGPAHVKGVGDIDGDGFCDALIGGAGEPGGLFWYRYPMWTGHTIVPPFQDGFTTSMDVVDVDGDGDLDVLVPKGDSVGSSVWWYENPRPGGDPATNSWTEHAIGAAYAHNVKTGDFDADGRVDVAVRYDSTTVFFQTGPDQWTSVTINRRSQEGLAAGDIDGDGDLDLAIGGFWLENPRPWKDPVTHEWHERPVAPDWFPDAHVELGDVDLDGRLDIVMSRSEASNGRLSWFGAHNLEADQWAERVVDPAADYVHTIVVADMDLDGDTDIVAAEMHQSDDPHWVRLYVNDDATGTSWAYQVLATTGSHNMQAADFGGDGDLDLVGANWDGLTPFEMWRNDLHSELQLDNWQRHVIDGGRPDAAIFVTSEDINGDGLPDVVTGSWWYPNPGRPSGDWSRTTIGSPLNNMAAAYDFDGDGDVDILGTQGVGSTPDDRFAWARNDGGGAFTILTNIQQASGDLLQGASVARYSPGGPLEIVLSWQQESAAKQVISVPAAPSVDTWPWREISPVTQGRGVDGGDIDGDGDLDIAMGNVWLRNDDSTWTDIAIHVPASGAPDRVVAADMDGDGDLDMVVGYGNDPENKLAWYEHPLDPTTAWPEHLVDQLAGEAKSLDVADMDRDGDFDIVVGEYSAANPSVCGVFVYANADGVGDSWVRHVVYVGDEHHHGTQVVDVDVDGDFDIVSIGWSHQNVLLYENRSGGIFVNLPPTADAGSDLTVSDIDHNGLEVVTLDGSGSTDDIAISAYEWSEGGQFLAAGAVAPVTLTLGTHHIVLTVTDSDGVTDTDSVQVIVESSPLALDDWQRHVIDNAKPYRTIFVDHADVNGDDLEDVVTGGWVYTNPGSPAGAWLRESLGTPLNNMAAVYDFDGDGDVDVLGTQGIGSTPNDTLVWAQNDGNGVFIIHSNIEPADGDVLSGIAVSRFQPGGPLGVALSWNDLTKGTQLLSLPQDPASGTWTWSQLSTFGLGAALGGGDIDRDGDRDLSLGTYWLRNDGAVWSPYLIHPGASPARNCIADMNGDGRSDVVMGTSSEGVSGSLLWYEQPSDPLMIWPEHVVADSVVGGGMSLDVADLDSDGDFDLVVGEHDLDVAAGSMLRLFVFENLDGVGGQWQAHVVFTGDEHHNGSRVVDIDNDGDVDIVSIGWTTDVVTLYENLAITGPGGGIVAAPTVSPPGGSFAGPVTVTLLTGTAGASIYYTLDGTTPSESNTEYLAPFTLSEGVTLKAIALKPGLTPSDVTAAVFAINIDTIPPAVISVRAVTDSTRIRVKFSELLDSTTAQADTNFTVDNGVDILAATLAPDGQTVLLECTPLTLGLDYALTVNGVKDRAVPPNIIVPNSQFVFQFTNIQRVTDSLRVFYTFQAGAGDTIFDVSGIAPRLDLHIADTTRVSWIVGGGLAVTTEADIATLGTATKLIAACMATDEITVEAWIKPANTTQYGPARIVTLSMSTTARNFTLGQGTTSSSPPDVFDVRLRTTTTTSNGQPSVTTPPGTATTALTHVTYTRDTLGVARIYVNAQEVVSAVVSGDLSDWALTPRLRIANEEGGGRPWFGDYYQVAVYNRALTADEVAQNFAADSSAVAATAAPPLAADEMPAALPERFALSANAPNPFNPSTTIRYEVPAPGARVTIRIYDVAGRTVRTLVAGFEPAGRRSVTWRGENDNGAPVASGVYFYRMSAPGFERARRMVFLK